MNAKTVTYLIFCLALALSSLQGADDDKSRELQSLQQDIDRYEKDLQKRKHDEQIAANFIASLDKKIDLTAKALYELRVQLDKDNGEIKRLEKEISLLESQIEKLRKIIKKRLVSFYKYGRRRDVELLLVGNSWQTANMWLRYEKLIAQNDMRNYKALVSKKEKLARDREKLKDILAGREKALAEQQRYTTQLKKTRNKRQAHLLSLRSNRRYLEKNVQQLTAAQEQIKRLISKSERLRVEKEQQIVDQNIVPKPTRNYSFAAMKGRLPWPTKGTVISHFGRYRHPVLNTVTENLGIEIKAPLGSPVKAIDRGMVETITWQRGRGNIVIISHDDGFYTVYTHLAEIRVNLMDQVEAGQVIGTVGDSGSLSGPVLHFQIWKNTKNLNPEEWLS